MGTLDSENREAINSTMPESWCRVQTTQPSRQIGESKPRTSRLIVQDSWSEDMDKELHKLLVILPKHMYKIEFRTRPWLSG
jgi:hypothetical protein